MRLMSELCVALAVSSLLVSCAPGLNGGSAVEDTRLDAVRQVEFESTRLAPLEIKALAKAVGRADRDGKTLKLKLTDGETLGLQDSAVDDCVLKPAACRGYLLVADLPGQHFFLVSVTHYEGGEFLLIDDRTGRRTEVDAVPAFSPDQKRFLVIAQNEAYGSFYGLQVWRRDGDAAVLEWQHSLAGDAPEWRGGAAPGACPSETFADLVRWRGNDRIDLDLSSPRLDRCPEAHWPTIIQYGANGWGMETQWPRGR